MAAKTKAPNDASGGAATPRETDAEKPARESSNGSTSKNGSATNGSTSKNGSTNGDAEPKGLVDAVTTVAGRVESVAAEKAESAVSGRGFATVLGWAAENVVAMTRIGGDLADLAVRNLRLAGRKDLARLGTQQARTEDKLERLLQEVQRLEAELRRARGNERS